MRGEEAEGFAAEAGASMVGGTATTEDIMAGMAHESSSHLAMSPPTISLSAEDHGRQPMGESVRFLCS
jgi:hypothetical protein